MNDRWKDFGVISVCLGVIFLLLGIGWIGGSVIYGEDGYAFGCAPQLLAGGIIADSTTRLIAGVVLLLLGSLCYYYGRRLSTGLPSGEKEAVSIHTSRTTGNSLLILGVVLLLIAVPAMWRSINYAIVEKYTGFLLKDMAVLIPILIIGALCLYFRARIIRSLPPPKEETQEDEG